jgi:hypothetical protein
MKEGVALGVGWASTDIAVIALKNSPARGRAMPSETETDWEGNFTCAI